MPECGHCGADIQMEPERAVEDDLREEVVTHTFDPADSIAVARKDYYCGPGCAAAAFGGATEE